LSSLIDDRAILPAVLSAELAREGDSCQPQRIVLLEEHELLRAGLRSVLSPQSWVAACFGAASVEVAWHLVQRHHPQIVLVSDSLPEAAGLAVCRQFAERMPLVKPVLMSGARPVSRRVALANGAVAALPKHMPATALVMALRKVAHGDQVFRKEAEWPSGELSGRELEVVQFLVAGLSNPEVATRMGLSAWTVKQHTSAIYRKLIVRNRAQAVSRALELGLAEPARG